MIVLPSPSVNQFRLRFSGKYSTAYQQVIIADNCYEHITGNYNNRFQSGAHEWVILAQIYLDTSHIYLKVAI